MRVWRDPASGEVHVQGRLSVHTVAAVRTALHDAVDRGEGDIVLVLTDAEIDDVTGLGVLVAVHRRAAGAGRRLVLRGMSQRLAELLDATGLWRRLHVAEPLERPAPAA
jgi:anti-anti-sigma factor